MLAIHCLKNFPISPIILDSHRTFCVKKTSRMSFTVFLLWCMFSEISMHFAMLMRKHLNHWEKQGRPSWLFSVNKGSSTSWICTSLFQTNKPLAVELRVKKKRWDVSWATELWLVVCSWTRMRCHDLVTTKAWGSLGIKEEISSRNSIEGKNSYQPWQVMVHSASQEHS